MSTPIDPSNLAEFVRKFRLQASRVKRFKFGTDKHGEASFDVVLATKKTMKSLGDAAEPVRLILHFRGVEEFRFQKRPGGQALPKAECRLGSFEGLVYVDFDAYPLGSGDVPRLHDFRASDAFVGCSNLSYTLIEKKRAAV